MRKVVSVAGTILAALTPAWGDATGTVDPKAAVEFVLSVCLPAMDEVANVERMGQENKWFGLPTTAYDSKYTMPHLGWRADGYSVRVWSFTPGNFLAVLSGCVLT